MDAIQALQMTNRIYERLNARREPIEKSERYYLGEQPLNFATDEWRKANAARYTGFSDNWCRPVADAENERIRHTGLKVPEEFGGAAKHLWRVWRANDMEAQSSQGFLSTLNASRSFVFVWGDAEGPVQTWEHPAQVEIEYSWENRRKRVAALKTWVDEKLEYATLYTPDEVFKWQRSRVTPSDDRQSQAQQAKQGSQSSGGWTPREVPGEVWPLTNPIGRVPIVEVPNRPLLGRDPISEIQGVMAMQDAINLLWAYLFLAADYASMDARVIIGGEPPKLPVLDSNGRKIGEKQIEMKDLQEKRFLWLTNPEAKIASYPKAQLDQFTEVIELAVGHVAAQTRTPPTYLVTRTGMSNVNGEGLKASEIGLVKKTIEFNLFATPSMREVHVLTALAMGDKGLAEAARQATLTWMNPEIRSESQLADALGKKRAMGYPLEYLMELDGIDPMDIDRILAMREQEMLDPQITAAMRPMVEASDAPEDGD